MGWQIDFVPYATAKTAIAEHTIIDIFDDDFDLEPVSYSGVDYFIPETRFLTISFRQDQWLDSYLSPFILGIGQRLAETKYWYYCIRLLYNGNTEFIGYADPAGIEYDQDHMIYKIKCCNTLGYMKYKSSLNEVELDDFPSTQLSGVLGVSLLNMIVASGLAGYTTDLLDVNIIHNFAAYGGASIINVTDIQYYSKNQDSDLIDTLSNIQSNVYLNNDYFMMPGFNWWGSTNTREQLEEFLGNTPYIQGRKLLFIKRRRNELFPNKPGGSTHPGVHVLLLFDCVIINDLTMTRLLIKKTIQIQPDGMVYPGTVYCVYGAHYYTDLANIEEVWDDEAQYNNAVSIYTYPGNNLSLQNTHGLYSFYQDQGKLKFTGEIVMENLVWKEGGTSNYMSILQFMMRLMNLLVYVNKEGDITVTDRNLESPPTSIEIDQDDIVSFRIVGTYFGKTEGDGNLIGDNNSASIKNIIETNNSNLMLSEIPHEARIEIKNNYLLDIDNYITIYNHIYRIFSINLDKRRRIYEIRGWRIYE